ncbi:class F sortase [Nonomuraea dietziae]|uniref:class F sortase n=1 Tax=Nonomuraea dietziae TaxID=65515 RepID=UPI0031D780DE
MPVGFEEGRIASPPLSASQRVGWFSMGPKPGATGAAHPGRPLRQHHGPRGLLPAERAASRPLIYVTRKGRPAAALPRHQEGTYPKDDFPGMEVYADPGRPELRLITCSGAFDTSTRHYVDNTVVYATLVGRG